MSKHRTKIILIAIFVCVALISVILYFVLNNDSNKTEDASRPVPTVSVLQGDGEPSVQNSAAPSGTSQTLAPNTMNPDSDSDGKASDAITTAKPASPDKSGESNTDDINSNVVTLDDLENNQSNPKPTQKPKTAKKPKATDKPKTKKTPPPHSSPSPNPQDDGWTDWY